MALQRGDTIVCAFTKGKQGNPISLSPEGKIVVLSRANAENVELHQAYACTIKAVGQARDDGTPRSYVAHLDHALRDDDYDVILNADFERSILTLGLRWPTKFASLKRREFPAEVHEEYVPARGQDAERLVLTLQHGSARRSMELSREEALRRGLRFNHFVRAPPPQRAFTPAPELALSRAPPGWTPTLRDHTGYIVEPTRNLLPALDEARRLLPDAALIAAARRRVLEVVALQAYEPLPLSSPASIHAEHALTVLARLACAGGTPQSALAAAESRLVLRRSCLIPASQLLQVLAVLEPSFQGTPDGVSVEQRAFLASASQRSSGAWAPSNWDLRDGRVHLSLDQARTWLADQVHARAMREELSPIPIQLESLRLEAALIAGELASAPRGRASTLVLEALPPCVAHALKAALKRSLSEAEAYNAGALLCAAGVPSAKVHHALHGTAKASPGQLETTQALRTRRQDLRPPTCRINRELGICAWDCGVPSPLEYYLRKVAP